MISRVIQVVDTVDVSIADIMVPVEHEEQTRAWFLCFASSPVSLPVNIPQAGFCIGEGILFTVSVNNRSPMAVVLRLPSIEQMCFEMGH